MTFYVALLLAKKLEYLQENNQLALTQIPVDELVSLWMH